MLQYRLILFLINDRVTEVKDKELRTPSYYTDPKIICPCPVKSEAFGCVSSV